MNKEEIEQGMKCCNEFLCGECPYEKYDDKVSHQYTMRCIHMLMQDINKLYFGDNINSQINSFMCRLEVENMKKQICICDHCGAEFNPINGYSDMEIDDFDFIKVIDLCTDCHQ